MLSIPWIARMLVLALAGALIALPGGAVNADDDDDDDDDEALDGVTELVVKLAPGVDVASINTDFGTATVDVRLRSRGIYLLQPRDRGRDLGEVADAMEDDARVIYAEPNFAADSPEGNPRHRAVSGGLPTETAADPGSQRAVANLGIAAAHEVSQGSGALVAVLDTGIQFDHPYFAGRIATGGYDYVDDDSLPAEARNGRDDDGDGLVDETFGHGTHVAGIVALVAPAAKVLPQRVLDTDGRGDVYTAAEAIYDALKRGADVISMSFSTTATSELLEESLDDAADHAVLVASAGNDGATSPRFPAAEDDVLAVTATDDADQRTAWANFGAWVDVAAPGHEIASAFPLATYARWSGTSMAAPWVSGQAALLSAAYPGIDSERLADHIVLTAKPIGAGNGSGRVRVDHSLLTPPPVDEDEDEDEDDDG